MPFSLYIVELRIDCQDIVLQRKLLCIFCNLKTSLKHSIWVKKTSYWEEIELKSKTIEEKVLNQIEPIYQRQFSNQIEFVRLTRLDFPIWLIPLDLKTRPEYLIWFSKKVKFYLSTRYNAISYLTTSINFTVS